MPTILSKYQSSDVIDNPFPHIVLENIFPENQYERLLETYPLNSGNLGLIGIKRPKKNTRYQISCEHIENNKNILSDEWQELYANNTTAELYNDFLRIFGSRLKQYFKIKDVHRLSNPSEIGKRNIHSSEIFLDFQPGINTPARRFFPSRVRGPHLDNPVEIFAILIYFSSKNDNVFGGDLQICKSLVSRNKFHGKLEISDDQVSVVKKIEYKRNSGIVFLNSAQSIHSISKRRRSDEDRRLLNIIAENNHPLFTTR